MAVAMAGHALGLALIEGIPLPSRGADADATLTDIVVESPAVPSAEAAPEARPPDEGSQVAMVYAPRAPAELRQTSPEPSTSGEPTEITAPPEPGSGALRGLSNDALGIGSRNVFVGGTWPAGPEASAHPGGSRNVAPGIQQSLSDALRDNDTALGLGSGGALVGQLEEATRSGDTPWDSSATFEVFADASGHVTQIRIAGVSEALEDWKKVARALLAAFGDRTLNVPSRAAGIVVTLRVTSQRLLPSGSAPRYEPRVSDPSAVEHLVKHLDTPGNAPSAAAQPGREAQAPPAGSAQQLEIMKVNPHLEENTSPGGEGTRAQVPSQQESVVDVLKFGFDVSDIGARPMRVVHARIVRERPLPGPPR